MALNHSGSRAEELAQRYLERAGLHTLARNFHCKTGEIDLVMQDGDTLVFVEVRHRQASRFSGAAGTVDARKQRKIISAAMQFRRRTPELATLPCRFDVIAYDGTLETGIQPHWIRRAFECTW